MHVIATAGHVDHGKSTLVRALTGMEPDRWAEERRRGHDDRPRLRLDRPCPPGAEVAFVDVPGHERFVPNMLAGVGPVPAVLIVVAADEGWMPQSAEHLAALDALGVRHGAARRHPQRPRRSRAGAGAEARERARRAPRSATSRRSRSAAAPAPACDELRAALDDAARPALPAPDPDAAVRLWVDRALHHPRHRHRRHRHAARRAGSGSATSWSSAGPPGPGPRPAVARAGPVEAAPAVARVAVNLRGVAREAVARGDVLLTPGAFEPHRLVDVRLDGRGARRACPSGRSCTSARPTVAVPGAPARRRTSSGCGWRTRCRCGSATARCCAIRAAGPIWGAGVLDPAPPPLGRRGAARARAAALTSYDDSLAGQLAARGLARRSLLHRIGVTDEVLPPGAAEAADWLVSPALAEELGDRLATAVERLATPLQPGVTEAALAHELELPDVALVAALVRPPLRLEGGRVRGDSPPSLPPALAAAVEALRVDLSAAPFAAPDARRLADLGLDARALAALHRSGHLLRVAEGIVLLPGADDAAVAVLAGLPQPFTTSEARQALGTSRRVALPLLAHLDRTGRTLRLPDDTRRVRGG